MQATLAEGERLLRQQFCKSAEGIGNPIELPANYLGSNPLRLSGPLRSSRPSTCPSGMAGTPANHDMGPRHSNVTTRMQRHTTNFHATHRLINRKPCLILGNLDLQSFLCFFDSRPVSVEKLQPWVPKRLRCQPPIRATRMHCLACQEKKRESTLMLRLPV